MKTFKRIFNTVALVVAFFLVVMNADGQTPQYTWARDLPGYFVPGEYAQGGVSICVDPFGNVYETGSYTGPNPDDQDVTSDYIYIAKYDAIGNLKWLKSNLSAASDGYGICSDAAGNIYLTGVYWWEVPPTFDTITLVPYGNWNMFIAKFDTSGHAIWAKTANAPYSYSRGLSLDAHANIYVTGDFYPNISFDNVALSFSANNQGNMCLFKFDSSGTALWAQSTIGSDYPGTSGYGVSSDADGNVFVTGEFFSDTLQFGSTNIYIHSKDSSDLPNGYPDIFLAEYNPSGNLLWAQSIGGNSYDYGLGVSADGFGNVYLTGFYSDAYLNDSLICGNFTLHDSNQDLQSRLSEAFIAKYNSSGSCLWAKSSEGSGDVTSNKVTVDASGNAYIIGYSYPSIENSTYDTLTFDSITVINAGYIDFVIKFTPNGNISWIKSTVADYTSGHGICIDAANNIYTTGGVGNETVYFDSTVIMMPPGNEDGNIFTAKLSPPCANPLAPTIAVNGSTTICANRSVSLDAGSYTYYLWNTGAVGETIALSTAGVNVATVTVTDANGCTGTATISVDIAVNPIPTPVITPSGPVAFFPPDSVILAANNGYNAYVWSTGASTENITVNSTGTFTVTVTDSNGCEGTTSQYVNTNGGGVWVQKTNFGGIQRYGAYSFSIGGKGYIGGGAINYSEIGDLWQYDTTTNAWTQEANLPIPQYLGCSFSIGDLGYICCGIGDNYYNNLWAYNPTTNTWTSKAQFPGVARFAPNSFVVNGKAYVGTGAYGHEYFNDLYEYTPDADSGTWVQKANLPGGVRYSAVSFSIGPMGYMGLGANDSTIFSDFYQYNPSTDSWTSTAPFPGAARNYASTFTINGEGYICCGNNINSQSVSDCWKYNPSSNSWHPITNYENGAGQPRWVCAPFSIGNRAFMGTGQNRNTDEYENDFWEYSPTPCNLSTPVITANGPTTFNFPGSVSLDAGTFASYLWSTGATTESITASITGNYSVTVTDGNGCMGVAAQLVVVTPNSQNINVLYGMTYAGGPNDYGTIFHYNPATNVLTNDFNFNGTNGQGPNGSLMQASNGLLYGATSEVAIGRHGTLFKFNPLNDSLTTVVNFDSANGSVPTGGLIQTSNGLIYGMTAEGGIYGFGTIFVFNPATDSLTTLISFIPDSGGNPQGSLMQASNGLIYGMTAGGGIYYGGTLFSLNPLTNNYTTLVNLSSASGVGPDGCLIQASNGKLYGITENGGTYMDGALFEYDPITDSLTELINFDGTNGNSPSGNLIQIPDGNMYGMTAFNNNAVTYGSMFEFNNLTDSLTTIINFDNSNGDPGGSLIQASNGKIYGTTDAGGALGTSGTLFEYDPITNNFTFNIYFNRFITGSGPGTLLELSIPNTCPTPPTPSIHSSTPTTFCQGTSDTLDAGSYSTYLWSTGASTETIIASSSGTYSVTVSDASGCTGTASIVITVGNPVPTIVSSGATTFCQGGSVTLDAGIFSTYLWSTGDSIETIIAMTGNTYSVTVSDTNSCTATASQMVTVNANPTPVIIPDETLPYCNYGHLSTGTYPSYLWSTFETRDTTFVGASGTYMVTVTDDNGCTGSASYDILVIPSPTPVITGNTTICDGQTTTLDAGGPYSAYAWINGATTETITVSQQGTYYLDVYDSVCYGYAQIYVTVNPNPVPSIYVYGDTTFCQGGQAVLDPGTFATYTWSNGDSTEYNAVTSSGNYMVTVTDNNGCAGIAAQAITVNQNPSPTISGPSSACAGSDVTLDAGSWTSYSWNNGATTESITENTSGYYAVVVTDANGCTGNANTYLTIFDVPYTYINLNSSSALCETVTLGAYSYNQITAYSWNTGDTTQTITVTSAGDYAVTITDNNGCPGTATLAVDSIPQSNVFIYVYGNATFCQGGSVYLDPGTYTSYLWNTGDTTELINVSTSDNYIVTVTNDIGCTGTASVLITVNPNPTPTITGPTSACAGSPFTLSTGLYSSYIWSDGDTTESTTTTNGGYIQVTVMDGNGCTGVASTFVTINPSPNPTIIPNGPTTFCSGGSVTLDAGSYLTYNWVTGETTESITVFGSEPYCVTVSDANGCTGATCINVDVFANPNPVITPNGPTSFCIGGSVGLNAGNSYTNYLWSNGATTQSITATTTGTYIVTVTASGGCTSSNSIAVTELPPPSPIVIPNGPTSFCAGGSVILDAGAYSSYHWSTGATTESITVTAANTYKVTVTTAQGCTGVSAGIIVTITPNITGLNITGATSVCTGVNVTLSTNTTYNSYLWSTGATTQSLNILATGIYYVTVSNGANCTATAHHSVTFQINPTPVIVPTNLSNICGGGNATLTVSSVYSTYNWSTAATTQAITINTGGTYTVTVLSTNGCTGTTSLIATSSCSLPSSLATSNISSTGGMANWMEPTCYYGFTLRISKHNQNIWTNHTITPNTHYTFSGLTHNTQYDWQIQTNCNASGTINSGFSASQTFTTLARLEEGETDNTDYAFNIYPNPTNDHVTIAFTVGIEEAYTIRLMDVTGRCVLQYALTSTIGENQFQLNLSTVAKGIYMVILQNKDAVLQSKIVVQ